MLPLADHPSPRILPLRVLLVMLAVCLGGSWFMVPRRGELIERLFKDRQYERVVAVLQDQVHGMTASDTNGLRQLDAGQLTTLSRLLNLTAREQLRTVFAAKNAPAYDAFVHNIVLAAIRYVDVLPPQEAYDLIAPAIDRVPDGFRMQVLATLAHNAHAVSRPELAAQALNLACQSPAAGWEVAREMTQSYRWSGKPAEAARQLRQWLTSHKDTLRADETSDARDLGFALALESNRPGDAFEICLMELQDAAASGSIPGKLMETSMSTALQSSRTRELLPWLARFVNGMPETRASVVDLHRDATKDATRFADYLHWAKILAQWSDWNSEFDTAFDHHLRLAALGDVQSRDRCVEIYDYLGRTEECCELLLTLGDMKDKPALNLLVATLLAELGRDDEAKPRFEAWLHSHPRDREAHFDYACLLEDMGDEAASRKAFEKMVREFPKDVPAMKRLAAACIRDADYAAALAIYGRMPESAHDHETLESYAMIAESLDDHAAEFRALHLTTKLDGGATTELYLDLAETAGYLPDTQPAIDVLNEGLVRLPHSAQLRIALANHCLHADRLDEALAAVTDESLKNNFEAAQAILAMSEVIGDAKRALAFLGSDVEQRFPLSAQNRLQLAVLHFNAGQVAECDRLFASVKEEKANLKVIAEARFHTGNYSESVRMMTAYLKTNPKATANEWLFLGDIYEQMGNFDEARKAYDYSLALLTADLPETASN